LATASCYLFAASSLGTYEVRSAPFVLHTLKGSILIVAAVAGFVALVAR